MGLQDTADGRLGQYGGRADGEKWTDWGDLWEVRLTILGYGLNMGGGVMKSKKTLEFLASGWTVVSLTNARNSRREGGWDVKEMMSWIWDC